VTSERRTHSCGLAARSQSHHSRNGRGLGAVIQLRTGKSPARTSAETSQSGTHSGPVESAHFHDDQRCIIEELTCTKLGNGLHKNIPNTIGPC